MKPARIASTAWVLGALGTMAWQAPTLASTVFCDRFSPAAKPAWGDQRGVWRTANRQYDATFPNNNPLTYTDVTTHAHLKDLSLIHI